MKYRMLKEGDIISDGDKFFYEGRWCETRKESIGFPWEKGLLKYRRPIREPKRQAKMIAVDGHREQAVQDAYRMPMPETCRECPVKEICAFPGLEDLTKSGAYGCLPCRRAWVRIYRYFARRAGK